MFYRHEGLMTRERLPTPADLFVYNASKTGISPILTDSRCFNKPLEFSPTLIDVDVTPTLDNLVTHNLSKVNFSSSSFSPERFPCMQLPGLDGISSLLRPKPVTILKICYLFHTKRGHIDFSLAEIRSMFPECAISEVINIFLIYYDVFGVYYDPLAYFLIFLTFDLPLNEILLISKSFIILQHDHISILFKLGVTNNFSQIEFITDQLNKQTLKSFDSVFNYDTANISSNMLTNPNFDFLNPKLPILPKNN